MKLQRMRCMLTGQSVCLQAGDLGLIRLLSRKTPWRRKWHLTPVLLPGKSHGQRSLVGYSPWDCRVGHDWVTSLSPAWKVQSITVIKWTNEVKKCPMISTHELPLSNEKEPRCTATWGTHTRYSAWQNSGPNNTQSQVLIHCGLCVKSSLFQWE